MIADSTAPAVLGDDRRGSVLIGGLCMGIIIVLGCIYIIDVAAAALSRMVAQNAADAIAMEGAVWHAQGMNFIVIINLVMAAVMALFIAIRVVEILLAVAIVITVIALAVAEAITALFGVGAAAIPPLQELLAVFREGEKQAISLERKVSDPIFTTLAYASNTERLVAAAFPYVSLARPITDSAGLEGHALATSLIPTALENWFSKAPNVPIVKGKDGKSYLFFWKGLACKDGSKTSSGKDCEGFEIESSFPARMGTLPQPTLVKYYVSKLDGKLGKLSKRGIAQTAADAISAGVGSLPVQEEDFYQVCGRAAEFMPAVFAAVFGGVGLDNGSAQRVGDILAATFGSMQKIACTPLPEVTKKLKGKVETARKLFCEGKQKEFEADPNNKDKKWDDKKQKDCQEEAKKKGTIRDPVDPESIKIARLWGLTASPANSPFLHVWATSPVPGGDVYWLDSKGEPPEPGSANGEFRHVCEDKVGDKKVTDAAGRGCAENSMFSPGWYGKLVPVRTLKDELAANFGEIMAGWLGRMLGKSITGIVDKVLAKTKLGKKYAASIERLFGARYGSLLTSSKVANGWWNRRFTSGELIGLTKLSGVSVMQKKGYPENLH
jgi:hypothetical protein